MKRGRSITSEASWPSKARPNYLTRLASLGPRREKQPADTASERANTNLRLLAYVFVALTLSYASMAMFLPPDPDTLTRYDLTLAQVRLLNLTVVLPLIAIWLMALYGYVRFKSYALLVKDSPEGGPLSRLADGLGILAFSLPITAVLGSVFNYLAVQNPDLLSLSVFVRNYSRLFFSVGAFLVIAWGAGSLLRTLKPERPKNPYTSNYSVLAIILLSSLFTWLIIARPLPADVAAGTYHSPNWVIILTLAVPYLFAWYLGAAACYRLYTYKNRVNGTLYKQVFGNLAVGIGIVVATSVIIQFILTISARLSRLDVTPVLLIVYLLLVLYAVGFGLVARSAKKFKKIEEA